MWQVPRGSLALFPRGWLSVFPQVGNLIVLGIKKNHRSWMLTTW